MWIFVIKYQPSGYGGHTTFIVRVHARDWPLAYPKLYKSLKERGTLRYMGSPTLEEFEAAFDEDYNIFSLKGVTIDSVSPEDDYYER
jgi:hypothetical protein